MLKQLHVYHFKSLDDETFEMRPLTLISGKNSSGKSSVLQAILLLARNCNPDNVKPMYSVVRKYMDPAETANRQVGADSFKLAAVFQDGESLSLTVDAAGAHCGGQTSQLLHEHTLYFLSANRLGPESVALYSREYKVGDNGEFLFGTYERLKFRCCDSNVAVNVIPSIFFRNDPFTTPFEAALKRLQTLYSENSPENVVFEDETVSFPEKDCGPDTLFFSQFHTQINFWLSFITQTWVTLCTRRVSPDQVCVNFLQENLCNIDPFNLGTGMSYLVKMLILCFLAVPGDVVLIENPEVHLHPEAQARLGIFFGFMASQGIQLIIETHCEHLINKIRFQVYTGALSPDHTVLYYRNIIRESFQKITIDHDGHFNDAQGRKAAFPSGFFDTSLDELLELA